MDSQLLQLFKAFGSQSPVIVAGMFLLVAAFTKVGKERGAGLLLCGAIGFIFLSIALPIFYILIFPKIMEKMDGADIGRIHGILSFVISFFWAFCIGSIGISTLMRRTPPPDVPVMDA